MKQLASALAAFVGSSGQAWGWKMRIRTLLASLLVATTAGTVAAHAEATIIWSAPTNQTGSETDILNNGVLFAAATPGPTTTVNGITFATQSGFSGGTISFGTNTDITYSGIQVPFATYGSASTPPYDAAYALLVGSGVYTGGQPAGAAAINLNNLTVGQTYQVQVIEAFWNNNWATNYTAGNSSGLVNLTGPDVGAGSSSVPQYVVGTFVADSSSETISLSSPTNYVVPDAISVLTVPEPATWAMFLVGFGAMGFMMRGSRRKDAAATA